MHLVDGQILVEAKDLSPGLAWAGVAIGLLLWATGWRLRRFWVSVGATAVAGIWALSRGHEAGGQALLLALLLALGAGALAQELARVGAYVAAGLALRQVAGLVFPGEQELWVAFLAGGLAGVVYYRFWISPGDGLPRLDPSCCTLA